MDHIFFYALSMPKYELMWSSQQDSLANFDPIPQSLTEEKSLTPKETNP